MTPLSLMFSYQSSEFSLRYKVHCPVQIYSKYLVTFSEWKINLRKSLIPVNFMRDTIGSMCFVNNKYNSVLTVVAYFWVSMLRLISSHVFNKNKQTSKPALQTVHTWLDGRPLKIYNVWARFPGTKLINNWDFRWSKQLHQAVSHQ